MGISFNRLYINKLTKPVKIWVITKEYNTKLKDRWKNIFNVIPREDFGMVLMDFGMRAMMAGESMGSMGALGAAGSGALAGVAQRKEQGYQRGMEQEKMAGEEARADMATTRAQEAEDKKGAETYNTTAGMFKVNPDGSLEAMVDPESGERLMPSASDRRSVKAWEVEEWKQRFPGMNEQDVWLATASGLTPQQAYDRAQSKYNAWATSSSTFGSSTLRIPGKGDVKKKDLTDADIEAWKRGQVTNFGYSEGALPKGGPGEGGAALGGGGTTRAEAEEKFGKKFSDEQWKKYDERVNGKK